MIKCANCGAELEEGQKFCYNCGTPVPQVKKCIKCGVELALNMKFCPECGAKQDGTQKSAGGSEFSMGDKNVIAGDVIGRKEETHVAGNATIIKNEDQTKLTKKCHICGKIVAIVRGFDCPECGEFTCEDCYDNENNCCKNCTDEKEEHSINRYKEALRMVLADGRIEFSERKELISLQQELGLSSEKAKQLEDEMRNAGIQKDVLTTFEEANLNKAINLFYKDDNAEKALKLLKPIYDAHKNEEKVLDIFLAVLADVNPNDALEIINSLQVDVLSAFVAKIGIYIKQKDFVETEKLLKQALRIWHESSLLKCYQVVFYYAMYKQLGDFSFMEKACNVAETLGEAKNELELSYQVKVQAILQKEAGENIPEFEKDFCEQNGLYWHVMNDDLISNIDRKNIFVGKSEKDDFNKIQDALDYAAENAVVHVAPGVYKEHLVFKKKVHLIGIEEDIKQKSSAELPIVILDKEKSCELDVAAEIEGIVFTHEENLEFDNLQEFAEQELEFDDEYSTKRNGGTYGDDDFRALLWVKTNSRLKNIAVLCSDSHGITFSGRDAELEDSVIFHCLDNNIQCVENSNPNILNCTISNCWRSGLYLENNSEPEISGCEIYNHLSSGISITDNAKGTYKDCKIHDNESQGIYIYASSEPEISGCEICNNFWFGISILENAKGTYKDCKIHDNEQGIAIQESSEPEVTDCEIFDNKENGITIFENSKPKIVDCKIHDNKTEGENYPGIVAGNESEPEINGCEIYNHLSYGIWINDNAKGTYADCKIHDNESQGIKIQDSSEPEVTACEIFDNKQNGITIWENSKPKIVDCKIHDNKKKGESYPGVVAFGDSEPEISGCEVYNHLSYGIWIKENAKGTYTDCEIHDNKHYGIKNDSSNSIDTSTCEEWNNE